MGLISGNAYLDLSLLIITLSLILIVGVVLVFCLVVEADTFRRRKHYQEDYRMLFNTDWSQKP